jgi:hypothetical protein
MTRIIYCWSVKTVEFLPDLHGRYRELKSITDFDISPGGKLHAKGIYRVNQKKLPLTAILPIAIRVIRVPINTK